MLHVVQNDPNVPVGEIGRCLESLGIAWRIVNAWEGEIFPPLSAVSAAVVLGGAMGVHEVDRYPFLAGVKTFMADAVAASIPLLGVCLGGQLLADVLGGRVTPSQYGERGTHAVQLTAAGRQDPLFQGLPDELVTFQWHYDSFAPPEGSVLLATSPACPSQAFRFGGLAYGLQFHPEVDRSILSVWTARKTAAGGTGTNRYLDEFIAREEEYRANGHRLLHNFVALSRLG